MKCKAKLPPGAALVIVLCAVVLATVMVVAFMVGARLERQSAFYHEERVRAEALAQTGVDHAIALLRCGMTGTSGTGASWISGPGMIIPVSSGTQGQPVPLSSGSANPSLTGNYQSPNLNAALLGGTASCPIDPTGAAMPVKWIYVRTNGTLDLADTPQYSATNPLIGRYAFWVDDNSSRINLNTAWTRNTGNTNPPADISRINLSSIAGFPYDEAHTLSAAHFFNSDSDLRAPDLVTAVNANRYAFTFYNHSLDGLNPFDKPKIYLTTQLSNLPPNLAALIQSGTAPYPSYYYFLDILNTPAVSGTSDPGIATNLSDQKVANVVNYLYSYLTNTNWPEYPGMSFAQKYWGATNDPRIFQLAVNIVEYVRAKESRQKIVSDINGYVSGNSFISRTGTSQNNAISIMNGQAMPLIGVNRTPFVVEAGAFFYSLVGWNPPQVCVMQMKLYLPPNIGIETVSGSDINMQRKIWYSNSRDPARANDWNTVSYGGRVVSPGGLGNANFYDVGVPNYFPLKPGGYVEVQEIDNEPNDDFAGMPPTTVYFWTTILPSNTPIGTLWNYSWRAPVDWGVAGWDPLTGEDKGIGPFSLSSLTQGPQTQSYQVDDPLLGAVSANWVPGAASWTGSNAVSTLGKPALNTVPPQDVDASGNLTNMGWRLPYPYGYVTASGSIPNPTGRVDSLAELGYVNTGAVCWTSGTTPGANGVPWRTLHLQPYSRTTYKNGTLPDWALLDLFAVPPTVTATNFVAQPYAWSTATNGVITPGAIGGRINLNALLPPFTTSTNRLVPLVALLTGAVNPVTNSTLANPATLAASIQNMTLASGGHLYDSTNGMYAHLGELAEIAGLADGGEESEANLFEPLAQTTISGNVFSVYTVGQALQQLPNGSFNVNGEKKLQATVERMPDVSPTTTGTNGFRIVVVRDLMP